MFGPGLGENLAASDLENDRPENCPIPSANLDAPERPDLAAAERAERSLAGRVARFVQFPQEVLDLAGVSRESAAGRVTFWVTVAGQVIASVVTIGVVRLIGRAAVAVVELIG
jgi:hypothetical protein